MGWAAPPAGILITGAERRGGSVRDRAEATGHCIVEGRSAGSSASRDTSTTHLCIPAPMIVCNGVHRAEGALATHLSRPHELPQPSHDLRRAMIASATTMS